MVSPLAWMPLAVMELGIGDAPVHFLLAFAAVWPIVLKVAAILGHLLTGLRLAIGLIWIVLAPADGDYRLIICIAGFLG